MGSGYFPQKLYSDPLTVKTFSFGKDLCPRLMNERAHMKEGYITKCPTGCLKCNSSSCNSCDLSSEKPFL
jgi:hypothetical protein